MEGGYSLLRIIMIDCHIEGRVAELKVDNHTNISGTNAAGKTTLQRLLPLFWGELPSNIQRKSKVKATVPEFYLPRESSLLVYEYIRVTGQLCQVLICADSKRDKLQYRFVKKQYCEDDYGVRKEDGKYKPGSVRDIGANLRRKGYECSELLSTPDFRAVIQNNRQHLRKNSKIRSNLPSLAYQFSMCDANESLVHMEKIVTAILSKHGKLDAMRQMVAQIIQENSQAFEAPKIDGAALQVMTNDISMLQAFKTNKRTFDALFSVGTEFKDNISEICKHKSQILDLRPLLEKTIKSLKSEAEVFAVKKKKLRGQWEYNRGEALMAKQDREFHKKTIDSRAESIHKKRDWWNGQDIRSLKADVEALPQRREVKLGAEERCSSMLEEVKGDELRLESQKRKVLEVFDQQQTEKHDQLKDLHGKLRSEEATYTDNKVQLSREFNADINDTKDRHRQELDEFSKRITELIISIRTTNGAPEEESWLLTVEFNHKEAVDVVTTLNNKLLVLTTTKGNLTTERSCEGQVFTELAHDIIELENKIHELSVAVYPPAGSLQEFLDESAPEWKNTIGRVIEPELLPRTDLDPIIHENGLSNDVCGILLHLSNIEPPTFLSDKEALIAMIAESEHVLNTLMNRRDKVKASLQKIKSELDETVHSIDVLGLRVTNAKVTVKSSEDLWSMAKIEVQQAVGARKQEAINQKNSEEMHRDTLAGKTLKNLK